MSLMAITRSLGYSRQSYYKHQELETKRLKEQDMIKAQIECIRSRMPKAGGLKLYKHLRAADIPIGRDRLFEMLRLWGWLIHKKRRYQKTTNSRHRFRKYNNLIKEQKPHHPHEVYVSDITYIRTREGFRYLYLITDMYSRKIVGYALTDNLTVEGALKALVMALKQWPGNTPLIHHSDRGIQYCCDDYVRMLTDANIRISMTEENHMYENALAERVNGILKDEFYLDQTIASHGLAKHLVRQSIDIYNNERLHMSLGYRTPNDVHCN